MSQPGLGTRALAIMLALSMFGGFVSLFVPDEHMLASAGSIPSTYSGDWVVTGYERYDGGSCVLTGNLIIQNGGNLVLNNLTLALDNVNDGDYLIELQFGGILRVFNSTIKSNSASQSNYFYTDGTLQVENSTVRDFGPNGYWTGIILDAGSATFKNDTIQNNDMGVIIQGAMPTIEDTIFDSNLEGGIWVEVGQPTFRNITITKTGGGMGWGGGYWTWGGGSATFYDSHITGNLGPGVYMEDATSDFYNTTITGNNIDISLDGWGMATEARLYNSKFGTKSLQEQGGGGLVKIVVYWYANLSATWQSDGANVTDGNYTVTDHLGALVSADLLDQNGQRTWLPVKEYEEKSTGKTSYGPFSFNVTGNRNSISRWDQVSTDIKKNTNVAVVLDDVPPLLSITSPKEGFATNKTTVTLSGLTEPQARVWVNDVPVTVDTGGSYSTPAGTPVSLNVEGKNVIKVKSVDRAGNERNVIVNVTRDTLVPALTIDTPKDDALFNFSTVLVQGTTEVGATLKVNGNKVTVGPSGNYYTNLTLAEGKDPITVISTDSVGNSVTLKENVTIDLTSPLLDIPEPVEGFRSRNPTIRVAGMTEPKSTVTVNGLPVPLSGSMFQTTVTLIEGLNTITVKDCDKAHNCVQKTINGTRDSIPPVLTVSAPPSVDQVLTNKGTFQMNGTTEPGASVAINSKAVEVVEDGSFTISLDLKEGENIFTIVSTDPYGNSASVSRKIKRDSIPPDLVVTSPVKDLRTKEKEIEVSGIAEAGALLTINGEKVTFVGTSFSLIVALDNEGSNNLLVTATDKAGNFVTTTVTVVRDTMVSLKIDGPINGTHTKNESVLVSGITDPKATVVINDLTIVTGSNGKFSTLVNLTLGDNTIAISTVDDLGNKASGSVLIIRDKKTVPKPGPGTGGNNLMLPLILIVIVIAGVGGGVGAMMMAKKKKAQQAPLQPQPPTIPAPQAPVQPQAPTQGYGAYGQYNQNYQYGQNGGPGGQQYPPPPPPPPNYPGY
jgi:hypothetical protein